jgi:ABC-type branched-subunit amino acid transport system ATPase component
MSVLLEISGLEKSFGGLKALGGVDLTVNEGEIVSVIGPNGAGKTTFFNAISGMLPSTESSEHRPVPDAGSIVFQGENITGLAPSEITKLGIARTFQNVRLFPNLTVLENVMVAQHCRTGQGVWGTIFQTPAFRKEEKAIEDRAKQVLSFFGSRLVGYRFDQPAFVLSYANRRRLEIARAMATDPTLILLDEPTAGMNPKETAELTGLINKMRDDLGLTIVVIEHEMRVVRDVSDRVAVLDHGVKIAEGSYEEVSTNEDVIEAYLGREHEEEAS